MSIHIPTLSLALIAGFLLLALELELGRGTRALRERIDLQVWARGSWALVGGFALLAARVVIPLPASVIGGNVLIGFGCALISAAIWQRLYGWLPPRRAWVTLFVVLMALIAAMLALTLAQRTALLSGVYLTLLLPGLWALMRRGWHAERSLRTVAITIGLAVAALAVRGTHAWLQPGQYQDLFQPSLGQGLTYLMAFVALLGAGFGYVLSVLEQTAARLEQAATHDALTGCLNRGAADELLAYELERGRRERTAVSYLLLDLDHFKQINDRHGHRTGDAVLRRFAEIVRGRLRASDVIGRVGGEEFGILLPGTPLEGAAQLAEGLRGSVEAAVLRLDDGKSLRFTVSAGVACAPPGQPATADELYARADAALYAAKHAGRNRVVVQPSQAS